MNDVSLNLFVHNIKWAEVNLSVLDHKVKTYCNWLSVVEWAADSLITQPLFCHKNGQQSYYVDKLNILQEEQNLHFLTL